MSPRRAASAVVIAVSAMTWGCAGIGFGGGPATLETVSISDGTALAPEWRTAVYGFVDGNTADLFLSDIPLTALTSGDLADLDATSGSILHIRYFVEPKAGRTPISFDASNTTIRQVVIAPAVAGVYGGGGFLLPRSDTGDSVFEGVMRRGTVRLVRSTEGFADRLGNAEVAGFVSATLDQASASAVSATLSHLLRERLGPETPAARR